MYKKRRQEVSQEKNCGRERLVSDHKEGRHLETI